MILLAKMIKLWTFYENVGHKQHTELQIVSIPKTNCYWGNCHL